MEKTYILGELNGPFIEYYEDGRIKKEENYTNNELDRSLGDKVSGIIKRILLILILGGIAFFSGIFE